MPNSSIYSSIFEDDGGISASHILWLENKEPFEEKCSTCGELPTRSSKVDPFDDPTCKCNFPSNVTTLEYIITHVFFHPHHSLASDEPINANLTLIRAIAIALRAFYDSYIHSVNNPGPEWLCLANVLDHGVLYDSLKYRPMKKEVIDSLLSSMRIGDVLVIPLGSDAILFRRQVRSILYEEFSISSSDVHQNATQHTAVYPNPALEIPEDVFLDPDFQSSLSDFLCDIETSRMKGLLAGILRAVGRPVEQIPITKRIPHSRCENWMRSELWFYVKVVIQLSLERSPAGCALYKTFIIFFMQNLADHAVQTDLSGDFLHLMLNKLLRRLTKLGSSAPQWISDAVLHTCTRLSETLQKRWLDMQPPNHLPQPLTLSQFDFTRDTQLSLCHTHEYVTSLIKNHDHSPPNATFVPRPYFKRNLNDFLSSEGAFFEQADNSDLLDTLRSFEHEVEHGVDDWLSGVTDVNTACVQLQVLIEQYLQRADKSSFYRENPDYLSAAYWTAIELWVVLDKLVTKEIPILTDYSPEVSLDTSVFLPHSVSLHRVNRLCQYLSARHTQAEQWLSVFSGTFTEQSFPIRYYDACPALWDLKARINKYAIPSDPLHAKAVIFELQPPLLFDIWRSVTCCLPGFQSSNYYAGDPYTELSQIPELKPYLINHPRSHVNLYVSLESREHWKFNYRFNISPSFIPPPVPSWTTYLDDDPIPAQFAYQLPIGPYQSLQKYLDSTTHTSNAILSIQEQCHQGLFLDEFIAFAHLRSGGSLQWINILRELRGRSLNFRHQEVFILLAQASRQTGPISNTGDLLWHEELKYPLFCHALLDELESLFNDLNAGLSDATGMATICLLICSVTSNNSVSVVERSIKLLRKVRRKTFHWLREQLYNSLISPVGEKGQEILWEMAAICRSTFAADPVIHSPQDIEAALSCVFLIRTGLLPGHKLIEKGSSTYSKLLLQRDHQLSLSLSGILKHAILADPTNLGIDLAIRNVWPTYSPGSHGWIPCQESPDSYWLVGQTVDTLDRPSQTMHVNLLDGSLILNGRPIGSGLPDAIMYHPMYYSLFREEEKLIVDPSNISGTDFVTRFMISDHSVHFSLRDDNLVIRAQQKGATILDLIPQEILEKDLPLILLEGLYVGWLNLSTFIIEIRPLSRAWKHSHDNWMIYPTSNSCYRITKGHASLVDFRSSTWTMASRPLECLDIPENLLITASESLIDTALSPSLHVTLPRYGLSFFINSDQQLESGDFKNMVCGENQHMGTLVGLANQLVLHHKHGIEQYLNPRYVIIPHGFVDQRQNGSQVCITISTYPESRKPVTYYTYKEDVVLGRLSGFSGLESKMYLARLHAMTSSTSKPDSLTGRTGIEEATSLVWSAGARFIQDRNNDQHAHWHASHIQALKNMKSPQLRFVATMFYDSPSSCPCMLQEAYLFPSEIIKHTQLKKDCGELELLRGFDHRDTEAKDFAFVIATAVHRWSSNAPMVNNISSWVKAWRDHVDGVTTALQTSSQTSYYIEKNKLKAYALLRDGAREGETSRRFQLLFTLPTLLFTNVPRSQHFSRDLQLLLLQTLVAFAQQPHIYPDSKDKPSCAEYSFSDLDGPYMERDVIYGHIRRARHTHGSVKDTLTDVKRWEHEDEVSTLLLKSWPSERVPRLPLDPDLYDIETLTTSLQLLFSNCYRNRKLLEHLTEIFCGPGPHFVLVPSTTPRNIPELSPNWKITLDRLLCERLALALPLRNRLRLKIEGTSAQLPALDDIPRPLHRFITSLSENGAPQFQREYVTHLHQSEHSLLTQGSNAMMTYKNTDKPTEEELQHHYAQCRVSYYKALDIVKEALGPKTDIEQRFYQFGQWPHITPFTLLRYLAFTSSVKLSDRWKMCLISLAHLALEVQRAQRLVHFLRDGLDEELFKELENEIDERVAIECPDWLLMELQGNFLIRPSQIDIAKEMMFPHSGESALIQVNMGEGKSSVIIPMCAAALADGKRLVRIIVPKALENQMLELLGDRLGGLVSRPICHLIFTRHTDDEVERIHQMMSCCRADCGVIVMRPEHALSLKLACVERHLVLKDDIETHAWRYSNFLERPWQKSFWKERKVAGSCTCRLYEGLMGDTCKWRKLWSIIEMDTRDILDESDEILHPRSQLIYALGHQQHFDGYPSRWAITQQVLWLTKKHLSSLDSHKIEFEAGPSGSFPHTRILHQDVGMQLISLIAEDVIQGRLSDLTFPLWLREPLRAFISRKDITLKTIKTVENYAQQGTSWNILLLLRGLLANNILLFVLTERRWRVDYGLDSGRTLLAVPYRAKDVPADAAEFGHPDITILLTCLSYYYGGLQAEQLRHSLQILLEQDDPSSGYTLWIADCASEYVPQSLRTLAGVSLVVSLGQWETQFFPLFKRNQRAIDLYLSTVVFPKYAKEFPGKIAASSWDLAERKKHLVTGFSGTNDGQYLLPISISQQDPESLCQTRTNAMALSHLLRPENASYLVTGNQRGERWTTHHLLEMLTADRPKIRVLLDIGAQILDLSNRQVAEAWLDLNATHDVAGAIYFNNNDELLVLSRNGREQSLSSSPFKQKLDQCITYLDHAHTRGTDIKFPVGYRAAVTLGPKLTKDSLVQGCMRMRKLGRGHSIKFFAPPDVDCAIRLATGKESKDVTTADILHWTIRETWADIHRRAPYWAQQGLQHKSQHQVWTGFCRNELVSKQLTDSWMQPERKTLADLYAPGHSTEITFPMILDEELRERCKYLGLTSLPNSRLEEEQEREVSREMEREREVERPHAAVPTEHSLHPDVTSFVRNGVILPASTAFRPIFSTLGNTSASTSEVSVWSPCILATEDFSKTIIEDGPLKGPMDAYLRPVRWILSGKIYRKDVLVVLSPFEADCLMPDIRLSEHVHLHLYTPRTSKTMKPCDDLMLYVVPPLPPHWNPPWLLIDQLNMFAGQLYLRDYTSYVRVSRFLGVHREELPRDATTTPRTNWLDMPGSLNLGIEETFEDNPLRFVMMLLAIRGRGMRFDQTHMGRLLQGWLLTEQDFPSFDSDTPSLASAGEPTALAGASGDRPLVSRTPLTSLMITSWTTSTRKEPFSWTVTDFLKLMQGNHGVA